MPNHTPHLLRILEARTFDVKDEPAMALQFFHSIRGFEAEV